MGITTILNNGVLGLTAQSRQLGSISSNIANATTTGYKATDTQFADIALRDRFGSVAGDPGAGVSTYNRLDQKSGTISQTGVTTNASILGNGFFVVQDVDFASGASTGTAAQAHPIELTRAGDFSTDKDGYLVNNAGKALMGVKLDPLNPSGSVASSTNALRPVSLAGMTRYFEPSTKATLALNLPPDQAVSGSASSAVASAGVGATLANTTAVSLNLVDANGASGSMMLRFQKIAQNEDGTTTWQVYAAGTTGASGAPVGSTKANDPATWQSLGTLNFARNGTLTGGADGTRVTMNANPGGNFPTTSIDFGAYGKPDESITSISGMNLGIRQSNNGIAAGTYQGAELTADGYVAATFAGGRERYIYRVPDAYVSNPQDLESVSGTVFRPTTESGAIKLGNFGSLSDGTGSGANTVGTSLGSGSVEGSNVKIENQFTTLIQAQRTYSAASKLVSTADEMTQTTLTLKA